MLTRGTVKWLQENGYPHLTEKELLEEYTPENRKIWKYDDYLKTHRIELDSIVAAVGAEALWKYIVHRLEEVFPEPRNYTNVIDEPEPQDYYPDEMTEIIDYLNESVKIAYGDKWKAIRDEELAEVKGLLQTEEKKKDIRDRLQNTVAENKGIKKIVRKLKEKLKESGVLPDIPHGTKNKNKENEEPKEEEAQGTTGAKVKYNMSAL